MEFSKILKIKKLKPEQTYDITIDNDHCFFGNDILTHNCNYRGSIHVHLFNHSDTDVYITQGEKIAQLLLIPVWNGTPEEVDTLDETDRGSGGFGSSGV